jgi:hypothetical protein
MTGAGMLQLSRILGLPDDQLVAGCLRGEIGEMPKH